VSRALVASPLNLFAISMRLFFGHQNRIHDASGEKCIINCGNPGVRVRA
jgi:hypothetical protein